MEKIVGTFGKLARSALVEQPLPVRIPGGAVSFTFDDVALTGMIEGARILEDDQVKGTFYVSAGLFEQESPCGPVGGMEQVVDLARRGHEIGCHTLSHWDCAAVALPDMLADIEANAAALRPVLGRPLDHFAYPYGSVTLRGRRQIGRRFASCRGARYGLNGLNSDAADLRANPLAEGYGAEQARRLIDAAVMRDAWVIFFTHDVQRDPSPYGCRPDEFAEVVRYAVDHAPVLPVGDVIGKLRNVKVAA